MRIYREMETDSQNIGFTGANVKWGLGNKQIC